MSRKLTKFMKAGLVLLLGLPSFAQHAGADWDKTYTVTVHDLCHHVPKRASKEFVAAVKARSNANREDAILHLKKALSFDPEFLSAINDLGVIYIESEHADLAAEQFERGIAVDPRAGSVYFNLAVAYFMQRHYGDCERVVRQFLYLEPSCPRGMLVLGMSLLLQSKFTAEAEWNLQKAAREFPVAQIYLGMEFLNKGNIEGARAQVTAYLQSGDKDEEAVLTADRLLQRIDQAAQTKPAGSQTGGAVSAGPGSNF